MYTDPQIVDTGKPGKGSYVKVYIDGKIHRFYSGRPFQVHCFPNECKTHPEKLRLLTMLQYELRKRLEKGWRPSNQRKEVETRRYTISESIAVVLDQIEKEDISPRYLEDLQLVAEEFKKYLKSKNSMSVVVQDIDTPFIERFLSFYMTSGAYYMNKRSTLSGFFGRIVRNGMVKVNPVKSTVRRKKDSVLNKGFTKDQLRGVLAYLERQHPPLYLCALLMYGCFLRPHREIRLLKRRHFNQDCTVITLAGSENKGKRVRVINVPEYVTQEIKRRSLDGLQPDAHMASGLSHPFNEDYFKTAWSRLRPEMLNQRVIEDYHSLYSFRHAAAIDVYLKTKDPDKVKQLMGHSNVLVTLAYLVSLGLVNQTTRADLPEL